MTTRRQFLSTAASSALVSLSPWVPNFLLQAAEQQGGAAGEKVLVVVQLTGGNDGLNTIVPYVDELYRRDRSVLALPTNQLLKINDQLGFHPSLKGFAKLLESGQLGIVQGVGYPNPNRSHFESMDIWHTAKQKRGALPTGWLGRYLDQTVKRDGRDVPALHLGAEKQPLALAADDVQTPSVQSLEKFRLELAGGENLEPTIRTAAANEQGQRDDLLKFLQHGTTSALASSKRVEEALGHYQTPLKYPETRLAEKLRTVAQLIDSGLTTRIYYVTLDGFDTHSQQAPAHTALLAELGDAMQSFVADLAHHGHADRVLLMSFSEFGRRVKENASGGTDHGAAAPMFLAGGKVRSGPIGKHPSLADLDDGDLKFHTDFRQVYATVLRDWLGWDADAVLGEKFAPVAVLG